MNKLFASILVFAFLAVSVNASTNGVTCDNSFVNDNWTVLAPGASRPAQFMGVVHQNGSATSYATLSGGLGTNATNDWGNGYTCYLYSPNSALEGSWLIRNTGVAPNISYGVYSDGYPWFQLFFSSGFYIDQATDITSGSLLCEAPTQLCEVGQNCSLAFYYTLNNNPNPNENRSTSYFDFTGFGGSMCPPVEIGVRYSRTTTYVNVTFDTAGTVQRHTNYSCLVEATDALGGHSNTTVTGVQNNATTATFLLGTQVANTTVISGTADCTTSNGTVLDRISWYWPLYLLDAWRIADVSFVYDRVNTVPGVVYVNEQITAIKFRVIDTQTFANHPGIESANLTLTLPAGLQCTSNGASVTSLQSIKTSGLSKYATAANKFIYVLNLSNAGLKCNKTGNISANLTVSRFAVNYSFIRLHYAFDSVDAHSDDIVIPVSATEWVIDNVQAFADWNKVDGDGSIDFWATVSKKNTRAPISALNNVSCNISIDYMNGSLATTYIGKRVNSTVGTQNYTSFWFDANISNATSFKGVQYAIVCTETFVPADNVYYGYENITAGQLYSAQNEVAVLSTALKTEGNKSAGIRKTNTSVALVQMDYNVSKAIPANSVWSYQFYPVSVTNITAVRLNVIYTFANGTALNAGFVYNNTPLIAGTWNNATNVTNSNPAVTYPTYNITIRQTVYVANNADLTDYVYFDNISIAGLVPANSSSFVKIGTFDDFSTSLITVFQCRPEAEATTPYDFYSVYFESGNPAFLSGRDYTCVLLDGVSTLQYNFSDSYANAYVAPSFDGAPIGGASYQFDYAKTAGPAFNNATYAMGGMGIAAILQAFKLAFVHDSGFNPWEEANYSTRVNAIAENSTTDANPTYSTFGELDIEVRERPTLRIGNPSLVITTKANASSKHNTSGEIGDDVKCSFSISNPESLAVDVYIDTYMVPDVPPKYSEFSHNPKDAPCMDESKDIQTTINGSMQYYTQDLNDIGQSKYCNSSATIDLFQERGYLVCAVTVKVAGSPAFPKYAYLPVYADRPKVEANQTMPDYGEDTLDVIFGYAEKLAARVFSSNESFMVALLALVCIVISVPIGYAMLVRKG